MADDRFPLITIEAARLRYPDGALLTNTILDEAAVRRFRPSDIDSIREELEGLSEYLDHIAADLALNEQPAPASA